MEDTSHKSGSPTAKSKLSRLFISQISKSDNLEEQEIDHSSEISEVASQLTLLRKRHDKLKESNSKKLQFYEKLKSELDSAEISSTIYESDNKSIQDKITQLQSQIEQSKKKYDSEKFNKKSYNYVLERMKEEKIALEIKSSSLQSSLKESKLSLEAETEKFRKIKESQYSSKQIMKEIKTVLAIDQRTKQEKIFQLQKTIKDKQEVEKRREERQKRQLDISEAAANDDKDSHEAKTREVFLLNRFWIKFIQRKLKNEVNKGNPIEQAFKKIKTTTGICEISEIVEKYLNQGESLQKLNEAVAQAENKLQKVKDYNFNVREKLSSTQIIETETGNPRKVYAEIEEMEKKLTECYKENAGIRDKLRKTVVAYDQLVNWAGKSCDALDINVKFEVPSGFNVMKTDHSLEEVFELILDKLTLIVGKTKNRKQEMKVAVDNFHKKKTGELLKMISTDSSKSKTQPLGSKRPSEVNLPRLRDKSTERLHP